MKVYSDFSDLPQLQGVVITIGSYDGVHSGHQHIIKELSSIARSRNTQSVLMTFDPHPRQVLFPDDNSLKLLTTKDEKVDLMSSYGVDILVVVPFTQALSQLSPEQYLRDILIKNFDPSIIVIGYDHKFGKGRTGDIQFLRNQSKQYKYEIREISAQQVEEITISSTKIRQSLLEGKIEISNQLLSRPYSITGTVIKGRQLGKGIGYPTANLEVSSKAKLIPMDGIYVSYIYIGNKRYKGMMYIGDIPTINEKNPKTIEVNIFDFDKDIYGEEVRLELLSFIRNDKKFDSLESLTGQLSQDKKDSLFYFSQLSIKKKPCRITIAILGYNSSSLLNTYLPSLIENNKKDIQLLYIDNASSDDSLEVLRSDFMEVEVVRLQENHGYAGGYNLGLKDVNSEYLVLVNSDIRVSKNWLSPLIEFMDTHPDYAAAMPKILSDKEPELFEYAGAAGGFLDALSYPYCRGRIFDTIESDIGQYDSIIDVDWVSGAAFIIRRQVYETLGGFDETFFAHQEEIDLCWRIRRSGYRLAVIPSSTVYHLGGGTLAYNNSRKVFLNFRNNLIMILKNEPISALLWKLPLRLILDGVAGFKMLLSGSISSVFAIIRAHFSVYYRFLIVFKNRGQIISDNEKVSRLGVTSILWSYYAKGIKTFLNIKHHNEEN